jgi:hypothetical protein
MTSLRPVSSASSTAESLHHNLLQFECNTITFCRPLIQHSTRKQGQREMIGIRSIIHRPVIEATKNSLSHDANFELEKKETPDDEDIHAPSSAYGYIRHRFYFPSKNDKRSAEYWRPNLNGRRVSGVTIQLKQAAHQSSGRAK